VNTEISTLKVTDNPEVVCIYTLY